MYIEITIKPLARASFQQQKQCFSTYSTALVRACILCIQEDCSESNIYLFLWEQQLIEGSQRRHLNAADEEFFFHPIYILVVLKFNVWPFDILGQT